MFAVFFAKRNFISLLIIIFFASTLSYSQGRLGYLVGTGLTWYNGDINEKSNKIISPDKVFKPFVRAGINYRLGSRMETTVAFFYGNIGGADSLAIEKDNRKRNLSFRSVIDELSVQLEYHLLSVYQKHKLNPFVFGGVGIFHFNPQAQLNGTWYDLQPLGTEGQFLPEGKYPHPYSLTQMSMPVGAGIYFQLNQHWRLKIDYATHFTRTDYLDDVSTTYPDLTSLGNMPNGNIAVALSNRRLDHVPKAGRARGNSQHNDNFSELGITLIYNPGNLRMGKPYKRNYYSRMNGRRLHKNALCRSW
jgi:hypothetical protein